MALLLPDLHVGGAERLTLDLATAARARGLAVDLLVARAEGPLLGAVPAGVRLIDLGAPRLRQVVAPLRAYLRTTPPLGLVAAMWPLPVLALVAGAGLGVPIVAAEHCSLLRQYAGQTARLLALRGSIRAAYRHAAAIVAVSDGLGRELAGLAGRPVTTIYNPVPVPRRSPVPPPPVAAWAAQPGPHLLGVGRLKAQKNHALLIEAMDLLRRDGAGPIPRLAIVGEGDARAALERRIAALGLGDLVILPGYSATPGDWYAAADLFVLASDYEGLGNVLVEAMHAGLRLVATDCPHGPAELLDRGRLGELVPVGDAGALAGAIRAALAQPPSPARQQARAAQFSLDRALDAYLHVLGAA